MHSIIKVSEIKKTVPAQNHYGDYTSYDLKSGNTDCIRRVIRIE